jgi:hypothetical protein
VTNLAAVQFEVIYDPAVVQVIDASAGQAGVQVRVDDAFSTGFIAQNVVDTENGRISFAATLLGSDKIDGNSGLIAIDWQPQAAGVSAITLENAILASTASQPIEFTAQNGSVEVTAICKFVAGMLALEGRTDHSGIIVTNAAGQQTETQTDGSFSIVGGGPLSFEHPGYLAGQADLPPGNAESQSTGLGTMTLLAGDVNADDVVDILDLVYVAQQYGSADTLADLNADGRVDILDLVLSAGNYGHRGPLTDWK